MAGVHALSSARSPIRYRRGARRPTTSDQFLTLDALPGRILFIGGGYVSFKLAHVGARAGAQVTVVHRGASGRPHAAGGHRPAPRNAGGEHREDRPAGFEADMVVHGVRDGFLRSTIWNSVRLASRTMRAVSGYKVLVEERTGHILGTHLFGPHADEVINLFALAMQARMTAADLERTIFAYPTVGSDMPHVL